MPTSSEISVTQISLVLVLEKSLPTQKNSPVQIQYLQNGKSLTVVQFAQKFNVADKTIKRDLQYLCENELIRRVGSDKTGEWKIIHK